MNIKLNMQVRDHKKKFKYQNHKNSNIVFKKQQLTENKCKWVTLYYVIRTLPTPVLHGHHFFFF